MSLGYQRAAQKSKKPEHLRFAAVFLPRSQNSFVVSVCLSVRPLGATWLHFGRIFIEFDI